jgi:hypothetical protein
MDTSHGVAGRLPMLRFTPTLFGVALLLALVPAYGQDFQKGLDAADRGDYPTALREWRPLAEQGLADAQTNLGLMYEYGEGVPKDYVQAYMWLNLAAAQGEEDAVKGLRDQA